MVTTVREEPKVCPHCFSSKVDRHPVEFAENIFICHDCAALLYVRREVTERTGPLFICPHCKAIEEIRIHGGEEWCGVCALDPNIETYGSKVLAHIWKRGAGIQGVLQRDVNMAKSDRPLGKFLRTSCGPHCPFGRLDQCPQEVSNLIKCWREEAEDSELPATDANTKKRARKQRRKERKKSLKQLQQIMKEEPRRALVVCAKSGWFEKVLYAKTPNLQQTGNTRGGPGA